MLSNDGSALDAVQAAVVVMEDSPHFNTGHGAALNTAGEYELDASIMDGATLKAGAVTLVRRIRNTQRLRPAAYLGSDGSRDGGRHRRRQYHGLSHHQRTFPHRRSGARLLKPDAAQRHLSCELNELELS